MEFTARREGKEQRVHFQEIQIVYFPLCPFDKKIESIIIQSWRWLGSEHYTHNKKSKKGKVNVCIRVLRELLKNVQGSDQFMKNYVFEKNSQTRGGEISRISP